MKKLPFILFAFLLFNIPAQAQNDNIIPCPQEYVGGYSYNTEARNLLSKSARLGDEKKYDEANAAITRLIEIEPNVADLYFRRAQYSLELKNYEDFLKDVQTGITLDACYHYRLYEIIIALQRTDNAAERLKFADILILSDNFKYLGYRFSSRTKFSIKDYVGVVEDSLKAVEFTPLNKNAETYFFEVSLGYYLGDHQIYTDYYLRMLDLLEKRNEYYAQNVVSEIRTRNGVKETVSINSELITELHKRIPFFILPVINYYFKQGQTEIALEFIKRIGRYEPKKSNYELRAHLYASRKYFKEAIEDATTLINLYKDDAKKQIEYLLFRGNGYEQTKEYEKAIADYETVISLDKGLEAKILRKIDEIKLKMQEEANRQK